MARLRKILLVMVSFAALVSLVLGVVVWNAIRHLRPEDVSRRIIQAVKTESGLDLVAAHVATSIAYHVVVTFTGARLLNGNETVASFGQIKLICGYRTLFFHRGLPLLSVTMEHPVVILPLRSATPGPMPVLDSAAVVDLRRMLVRLSNITRQILMFRATIEDRTGRVLFDQAAVRANHGRVASAWRVRLRGYFRGVDLPNFRIGASLAMAPEMDGPEVPFARGSLWFWDATLDDFVTRGFKLKGNLEGHLTFLVRNNGVVMGQAATQVLGFGISGSPFVRPVGPANLALTARLSHSPSGLDLSSFSISSDHQELLSGKGHLAPLPPDNLRVFLTMNPVHFGATQLKSLLSRFRGIPSRLMEYLGLITTGNLSLDHLTLKSTLKELESPSAKLLHQVASEVTLDGLAINPPGLPPIAELDGNLDYRGGIVRLTQSHCSFGSSTLAEIRLSGDLSHAPREIPYQVKVAGDFDFAQLFPVMRTYLADAGAQGLGKVKAVSGKAAAEVDLHGQLTGFAFAQPPDYRGVLRPENLDVTVASAPSEVKIFGGSVVVSPQEIVINRLELAPSRGSAWASGRIERPTPDSLKVTNLNLEFHGIHAEDWLPHLMATDEIDIHAPAVGNLSIASAANGLPYTIHGQVTFGPGQIKFAFLRAPVFITDSALLDLDGEGGKLTLHGATLEGSPLDMTVAVPDVTKPVIRIKALAQKIDLEAIRAVRLPWNPHPPSKPDDSHFEGHIEALQANLGRLQMKNLKASFKRDDYEWRVFDINADALGGHITMDLAGTKRDDWVHIKARAHDLDAEQVQDLAHNQAVLTGRLSSVADLWADTDGDFFQTLAGAVTATVKDGVLLKFKLLSRMLSLVDVSEWLNAEIPDPRVKGVPFRTINAYFAGEQGVFQTNNFLLDGPVMKITAAGQVNIATCALDMKVGMRPFQLLDTVFNKIPLIGSRLAQSQSGIVAAYFHVQGPVADPSVVPAPITSISHMLIKTLAIPINILAPETIK